MSTQCLSLLLASAEIVESSFSRAVSSIFEIDSSQRGKKTPRIARARSSTNLAKWLNSYVFLGVFLKYSFSRNQGHTVPVLPPCYFYVRRIARWRSRVSFFSIKTPIVKRETQRLTNFCITSFQVVSLNLNA